MNRFLILLLLSAIEIGLSACGSTAPQQSQIQITDSLPISTVGSPEEQVTEKNKAVLLALKAQDYTKFAQYFHPQHGVRFSAYAFVSEAEDVVLSKDAFLEQLASGIQLDWGSYDGSGDLIQLSIRDYIFRFVYDVDFLNAEKMSVNEFLGSGNSLNNLKEVYGDALFTENYFSGFEKQYNGMDWRSLRLVWSTYEGEYYLVGIIHDQWTI